MPDPTAVIAASATAIKRMYEIANKTNTNTLVGFVSSLSKMISDLKWSPSVRTSFEINLLRLCGRKVKMDEVPLVIPDFVEKQAAAAKALSAKKEVVETPIEAVAPVIKPSPFAEIKKEEAPKAEEVKKADEPSKETSLEAAKAPEESIIKKFEMPTLTGLFSAKKDEPAKENVEESNKEEPIKEEPVKEETPKKEEPIPVFAAPDMDDENEEETQDPEDIPMENQMDIFSFGTQSEPEKVQSQPEPISATLDPEPVTKEEPVSGGIFAGLSSSFMDDLTSIGANQPSSSTTETATEETSSDSSLYEPTGRIGETKQTALSATFDIAGLVTKKPVEEPIDPALMWESIKQELNTIDLTGTTLIIKDDCANIVFDQDPVMMALKANPENKKLSKCIKERIDGIEHVYMLRKVQALKQGLISEETSQSSSPSGGNMEADDFIQMVQQMGYNTEIHFGDN